MLVNFFLTKPGASGLKYPIILNKTSTNLIALDPKKDPLAQATVPRNDPASYLRIIYYLASTNFA